MQEGIALGSQNIQDKNLIHVESMKLIDESIYTGQMRRILNSNACSTPNQNSTLANTTAGFEVIKHGVGIQIWKDGAKYEGEWINGKACGKGVFYHVNGDVYDGEFREDRANG